MRGLGLAGNRRPALRSAQPAHGRALCAAAALVLAGVAPGCAAPGKGWAGSRELWSIRCLTLTGPTRFRTARRFEQALKQVDGLKPRLVQVFHDQSSSVIYYGRYERRYDPVAGRDFFRPDPLPDLKLIRKLSLTVGGSAVWPFALAVLDAWPAAPSGNPAWDLNNVQGYWSLQIAVFYNQGRMRARRRAAEEYCRILRQQGVEAYYHHGAVNSSVCVGVFPKQAIASFQREDPLSGTVRATSRIVAPRMLELQKKYPYNLENGHKVYDIVRDPRTGAKQRIPHPSFPVRLPNAGRPAAPPGE